MNGTRTMTLRLGLVLVLVGLAQCSQKQPATPSPDGIDPRVGGRGLKGPAAFADIGDREARAKAMFAEMAKVFQHPRCVNCHPQTERPLQGNEGRPHEPWVVRGNGGLGAPGMFCTTCHGTANYLTVPGNPNWVLAPEEMAWVDRSAEDICQQLKDTARNGGRNLEGVHRHLARDALVAYGWAPPAHLPPAPGSQATLAALFRAWMKSGAHCPSG